MPPSLAVDAVPELIKPALASLNIHEIPLATLHRGDADDSRWTCVWCTNNFAYMDKWARNEVQ